MNNSDIVVQHILSSFSITEEQFNEIMKSCISPVLRKYELLECSANLINYKIKLEQDDCLLDVVDNKCLLDILKKDELDEYKVLFAASRLEFLRHTS